MSNVFEVCAALTMDAGPFQRAVAAASRAGRSLQSDLSRSMNAAASSMNALRSSATGAWQAIAASIQAAIDKARTFAAITPGDNSSLPGHDTGLRYVPYDNYVARLHQGETVLTRLEADRWRAAERTAPAAAVDPEAIAAAVSQAVSGLTVQMDGKAVGRIVAPTVSAVMGHQTRARRYTG